jgi:HEAT repeat protein
MVLASRRKPVPTTAEPSSPGAQASSPVTAKSSAISATNPGQVGPTTPPFQSQLRVLTNLSLPLSERRKVAEELAQDGSEAALAALKQAFATAPEDMRAAIAESLGMCAGPECAKWLQELLQDPSTVVARGAVRALAGEGSAEAAAALLRLLGDVNTDSELRLSIAHNLGSVEQPGVTQALADLARTAQDPELAMAALSALGQRYFSQTEPFFKEYLSTPGISSELRVAAIEGLTQARDNPSALLLSMAADPDAEVRSAAAWALSATRDTGNVGAQLLDLLSQETDPKVRLRLYQALGNQESFDPGAALALVQNETNPSALLAGLDLLAKAVRDTPTPQLQTFFDNTAIAELKQIALTGNYDDRQKARTALARAHTPGALAALHDLAGQLAPPNLPPPGIPAQPK